MISKERLEDLINQGATIYWICGKQIEAKPLKHKYHKFFINDDELCEYNEQLGIGMWQQKLSKLFETKEDAEWDKEFKRIPRTDYLDLPTWEEFIEMEEICFFQKNHKQTIIRVLGTKYLGVETNFERYFTGDLTKENYTLACRKCKELFLGESNEENS